MKALKIIIVLVLVANGLYSLTSWLSEGDSEAQYQQAIETEAKKYDTQAAEGLDLPALTSVVKEVRSGQELERLLNEKDGVNNLDLDANGKVDYLYVEEFGNTNNKIGYSVMTEPAKDEKQEVATITIEKNQDNAEIQVIGNEQLYGENAVYNDHTPIVREKTPATQSNSPPYYPGYFYPRPLWMSPFHFGFYPPFYSPFGMMGMGMYSTRVTSYQTNTIQRGQNQHQSKSGNKIQSPNKGKSANKGIKRSLKKPTGTQKQFQSTAKKNLRSGGFGRSSNRTASQKRIGNNSRSGSRFGQSSSRRSSSGFGSNRFRSSSSGSRSFSFGGK